MSKEISIKFFLNKFCFIIFAFILVISGVYAEEENPDASDQQINDFSISGYGDKGRKTWDLTAKSADIFTNNIKLDTIVGNLYGEKEDIKLISERGDFDKEQGNVHLEKNVIITTSTGGRLTTDSLDWDRKNGIIATKDMVNIEKDNLSSIASGATGQPDLNKFTLEKDVTVKINPQPVENKPVLEKDKTIITCDGPLQIDYENNIAIFNNNVKVDTKNALIYGDIMYVYFVKASQDKGLEQSQPQVQAKANQTGTVMGSKIEKIITRGNVRIIRGDNISYSDEAVYNAADKKITLLGRPRLVLYSTEELGSTFEE